VHLQKIKLHLSADIILIWLLQLFDCGWVGFQ
jgi:hypothetical protein